MNKAINMASGFQREAYAAPRMDVVEMSQADLICASGQTEWYDDGDTEDWFND